MKIAVIVVVFVHSVIQLLLIFLSSLSFYFTPSLIRVIMQRGPLAETFLSFSDRKKVTKKTTNAAVNQFTVAHPVCLLVCRSVCLSAVFQQEALRATITGLASFSRAESETSRPSTQLLMA